MSKESGGEFDLGEFWIDSDNCARQGPLDQKKYGDAYVTRSINEYVEQVADKQQTPRERVYRVYLIVEVWPKPEKT